MLGVIILHCRNHETIKTDKDYQKKMHKIITQKKLSETAVEITKSRTKTNKLKKTQAMKMNEEYSW